MRPVADDDVHLGQQLVDGRLRSFGRYDELDPAVAEQPLKDLFGQGWKGKDTPPVSHSPSIALPG
ncbi:MAG: hypothetical protein NVSMB55_00820 [Mycobacteriales bacterium]